MVIKILIGIVFEIVYICKKWHYMHYHSKQAMGGGTGFSFLVLWLGKYRNTVMSCFWTVSPIGLLDLGRSSIPINICSLLFTIWGWKTENVCGLNVDFNLTGLSLRVELERGEWGMGWVEPLLTDRQNILTCLTSPNAHQRLESGERHCDMENWKWCPEIYKAKNYII